MRILNDRAEIAASAGEELGVSEWVGISQERIDLFADATGDRQWIHIDPERAADGPFGSTIAHGYLTLSMLPGLGAQVFAFAGHVARVNYGLNKVRFSRACHGRFQGPQSHGGARGQGADRGSRSRPAHRRDQGQRPTGMCRRDGPPSSCRTCRSTSHDDQVTLTPETIRKAPKVALHEHLDGGLRPATIAEIAAEIGHDLPAEPVLRPSASRSRSRRGQDRWSAISRRSCTPWAVMQRADLTRVTCEAVVDLAADGCVSPGRLHQLRAAPSRRTVDA